jgi:hypothetical protein
VFSKLPPKVFAFSRETIWTLFDTLLLRITMRNDPAFSKGYSPVRGEVHTSFFIGGTFVSAISDKFGINLAHQRKK